MNARLIFKDIDGKIVIGKPELDIDDALSTAKIMLKLKKTSIVLIQTIAGRFSYRVTKSGENYNIKSIINTNL